MSAVPPSPSAVTGVVLAGGRGLRMRGADKGLIAYRGRTLAQHALTTLQSQVGARLVSANRHLDRYAALGVPVVRDADDAFCGPLAGMLAALQAASTPWIVCLPCDTLGFPGDGVRRLCAAATIASAPAAYAVDATGPQYTVCALHRTLTPALAAALDSGHRAVRAFLNSQHAAAADFSDCTFANLNTPEALEC